MRALWNTFLLIMLLGLPVVSVTAQSQELPPADWYAVVWARGDDTLHWISPNGEPASITRPQLPEEALNANPQMRFSRDGRYLLLVAELSTGLNGIGIYDVQAGEFTQTHQAQPDEIIYLGREHTSNLAATQVAVGFASADFADTAWRIIIFDLVTGAAVDVLDNDTASWEMDIPPSIPVVTYYDVDESIGQEVIHFEMIPKTQSPTETVPAFKWYPALEAPADMGLSPYVYLDADINYLTGEIVRPYVDPNFPSLPAPDSGLNYNAIGRAVPTLEEIPPTGIWVDTDRYLYTPIWANGTDWVAFFTEAGEAESTEEPLIAGWQVVPRDGVITEKSLTPLSASAREVFGTPQGVLVIDIDNQVSHITSLDLIEGTLLYQSPDAQLSQIVYVSGEPDSFLLTGVGEPATVTTTTDVMTEDVTTATPIVATESEPTAQCEGALPSRLQVGSTAQVSNTDGIPLRVRQEPGGVVLTEIVEGTQFDVLAGPQCLDGYAWWQIELASGTVGWSAEGDNEDYWVEVLSLPTAIPTATVASTATAIPTEEDAMAETTSVPTVSAETTQEPSSTGDTTTEGEVTVGDGNCDASPESRITVGMNVTVQAAGGSLALRANPLDSTPVAQLPDQTVLPVVGGPACRTGYRQWQVRATIDGVLRDGWVSEGTVTRYFLEPTE